MHNKALFKLQEDVIKSFSYKIPEDPEQLLYDFYFLVGFVYGNEHIILKNVPEEDGEYRSAEFALNEAVKDCVTNLRVHMLDVLKRAMCSEIDNTYTDSNLSEGGEAELRIDTANFITQYYKEKGRTPYTIVASIQKKFSISDSKLFNICFEIFSWLKWRNSYGGKAWAKVANAAQKLLKSSTLPEQIMWIDHVYDLQHNTGTIFNKIESYAKLETESDSPFSWLYRALTWKSFKFVTAADYEDIVSPSLKRLAFYVAARLGAKKGMVDDVEESSFFIGESVSVLIQVEEGEEGYEALPATILEEAPSGAQYFVEIEWPDESTSQQWVFANMIESE